MDFNSIEPEQKEQHYKRKFGSFSEISTSSSNGSNNFSNTRT